MPASPNVSDVVVIGGGIIGCAVAYEAAKRGLSVLVVERDEPGSGATGAAGGFISIASKRPGPHMELARASARLYKTLEDELECPEGSLGYQRNGSLILAEGADRLPDLETFVHARTHADLALELWTPRDLGQAEPNLSPHLAGAVYCPTDAEVIPLRVLNAYRAAAERFGARFLTHAAVMKAQARGRAWELETTAGNVGAFQVVLAAGAWSAGVGEHFGIQVPVRPRRGQGILFPSPDRLIHHPMLSIGYFAAKYGPNDTTSNVEMSLWQRTDGAVFVGGTREWAGFDPHPAPDLLAEVRRRGERVLPKLKSFPSGSVALGFRPYSETGLPLLGPVRSVTGLFLATGHEGDGISLAPITGKLLAQALSGEAADIDMAPFRLQE
jgi:sarcosine oxidase subunit beta